MSFSPGGSITMVQWSGPTDQKRPSGEAKPNVATEQASQAGTTPAAGLRPNPVRARYRTPTVFRMPQAVVFRLRPWRGHPQRWNSVRPPAFGLSSCPRSDCIRWPVLPQAGVGAFRGHRPRNQASGFEENLKFRFWGSTKLTPGQKNVLDLSGGLAWGFAFFLVPLFPPLETR